MLDVGPFLGRQSSPLVLRNLIDVRRLSRRFVIRRIFVETGH